MLGPKAPCTGDKSPGPGCHSFSIMRGLFFFLLDHSGNRVRAGIVYGFRWLLKMQKQVGGNAGVCMSLPGRKRSGAALPLAGQTADEPRCDACR